jgi:uncharacterized protein YndB with AHSA1/START domain
VPRVETEIEIAVPPATVFDYATTPANWPKFWAITEGVSGEVDRPATVGARWIERVHLPVWKGEFHWEAVECDRPGHFLMRGSSHTDGPLGRLLKSEPGEIRYTLTATPGGTRFRRAMDYPSPPLLLRPWDALVSRPVMRRAIERALARLKQILEPASTA